MEKTSIDECVDEAYLLALIGDEAIPISDEKYAEELQIQEALFFTIHPHSDHRFPLYSVKTEVKTEEDEQKQRNPGNRETGESSQTQTQSKLIFCGICMETKHDSEIFKGLKKCTHLFCITCITKYMASKIHENIAKIECPDPNCKRVIEPEDCSSILPKEVFSWWLDALCESLIQGCQKFYCPLKECSVLLVDDGEAEVRKAECPSCRRLFCAKCKVAWHKGVTCEKFQMGEREEDIMVKKLAEKNKWGRCSKCGFIVEKSEGCLHITCRCRYEFCYNCGSKWSYTHGSCG